MNTNEAVEAVEVADKLIEAAQAKVREGDLHAAYCKLCEAIRLMRSAILGNR